MFKRSFSALVALALSSVVFAHGASESLTPATSAISRSETSAYAGNGGGLSISAAANKTTASTVGAASSLGVGIGPLKSASVEIGGAAASSSLSGAGNLSVGNASGGAVASGTGTSSIVGIGEAHTVTNGPKADVSGNAETITASVAKTGTNGLAISGGASASTFNAGASASQIKLGSFEQVSVDSHAVNTAVTTPGLSITLGTGTVQLQTEAASNAAGRAKVGSTVSQ